jgi:hypothetical protein
MSVSAILQGQGFGGVGGETLWSASVAGTGYAVGDRLRQIIAQQGANTIVTWINIDQQTILASTPTPAQITSNLRLLDGGGQVLPGGMRGRQSWAMHWDNSSLPSGATVASTGGNLDGSAVASSATYTVPAGKILRITSGRFAWLGGSVIAANSSQYAYGGAHIRVANGAAPSAGSASVAMMGLAAPTIGTNPASSDIAGIMSPLDLPDGTLDIAAGWQIGLFGGSNFSTVIIWGGLNGYLYNA